MTKLFINNQNGEKIAVLLDKATDQKGLVFIMHGLGAYKEQPQVLTFSRAFLENGFTTVRFDARNTVGESDGSYENASITSYYNDLNSVIDWAKTQEWYVEPFVLIGHSLGGICSALYAENFPSKVKALAPLSTVINWDIKVTSPMWKARMKEWEESGWRIDESKSRPGVIKKLNYSNFKNDFQKYDLLDKVDNLSMPVLMIVGENDGSTPPEHQKILFERLPGIKELHIIKSAGHTFREEAFLAQIKKIIQDWIKVIL